MASGAFTSRFYLNAAAGFVIVAMFLLTRLGALLIYRHSRNAERWSARLQSPADSDRGGTTTVMWAPTTVMWAPHDCNAVRARAFDISSLRRLFRISHPRTCISQFRR